MTQLLVEWYLVFRVYGFTPRQAAQIARHITFTVQEMRDCLKGDFDYFCKTASP